MIRENYHWVTRLRIERRLPGFPEPHCIAVSEAVSTFYRIIGAHRTKEQNCAVFQYTLSGRGCLQVKDQVFDIVRGKGFLCQVCNPEITYFYPEGETQPWRFVFFSFRETGSWVSTMNRDIGYVFELSPDSHPIRRILQFQEWSGGTFELKAGEGATLVTSLLTYLADAGRDKPSAGRDKDLVRRCKRLVDEKLFEACNAGVMAEALGVSLEHLSRVFRSETGETLYHFLLRRKMDQACIMLKESGATCRDVAISLGFEPGSHFARVFKRVVGITPREFREHGIPGW